MTLNISSIELWPRVLLLGAVCFAGCAGGTDSVGVNVVPRENSDTIDESDPVISQEHLNSESPIVLTFRKEPDSYESGDFDPSAIVGLGEGCAVVVYGQVTQVDEQAVQFEVSEILKGKDVLKRELNGDKLELPEKASSYSSCVSETVGWQANEECVLCLVKRTDGRRGLQVLYNSAGKFSVPIKGVFSIEDLRILLREEMLPEDRSLELIRSHGPRWVSRHSGKRNLHEDKWQKALLHFYQNHSEHGRLLTDLEFHSMIQYVKPATARKDELFADNIKRSFNNLTPRTKASATAWYRTFDPDFADMEPFN